MACADKKLSMEQRNVFRPSVLFWLPSLNLVMDSFPRLTADWFAVLAACSLSRQKKAKTLGLLITWEL